ncbi:PTS sugar transporter [Ligilactobacillus pobuzihii]|nr:PTS sugar transporter subunit IIC [Ligilactobacillus pobuzihii]GEN48434.1 PTS sugar transporter [Ligilactobacillus pobuzihii]
MIGQTIGIFVISMVGNLEDFMGTSFLGRPLVMCFLVGILFGDVHQGLVLGAALELIFMGMMAIGASIPPNEIVGGIVASALVMKNGYSMSVALALVIPIATVGMLFENFLYLVINPIMVHKADDMVEKDKLTSAANMHIWISLVRPVVLSLVITVAFAAGSGPITAFLKIIPQSFIDGMTIATNILPAVGFAMLLNMTFSNKLAPFFFMGFVLVTYFKLDMIAIAIIGTIVAAIIYIILNEIQEKGGSNGQGSNEETDEFSDDF